MIDFLLKISFNISESSPQFSFIEKPAKIKKHTEESYELLTWGDPIEEKDLYLNLRKQITK